MNGFLIKAVLDLAPEIGAILTKRGLSKPSDSELTVLLLAQLIKRQREEADRFDMMNKKLDYLRVLAEK